MLLSIFTLLMGTLSSGHRGPSCNLVLSLIYSQIKEPTSVNYLSNIDCRSCRPLPKSLFVQASVGSVVSRPCSGRPKLLHCSF